MKRTAFGITLLFLIVGMVVSFQNCSRKAFVSYSEEDKSQKMGTQPVFGEVSACEGANCPSNSNNGNAGNMGEIGGENSPVNPGGTTSIGGSVVTPGGTMSTGGTVGTNPINPGGGVTPGSNPNPSNPNVSINILQSVIPMNTPESPTLNFPELPTDYCYDDDVYFPVGYFVSNWVAGYHGSIYTENEFIVKLEYKNGTVACSFETSSIKAEILQSKQISVKTITTACPNLPNGSYRLRILGKAKGRDLLSPKPDFVECRSCESQIETAAYGSYVDRFQGVVVRKAYGEWCLGEAKPLFVMDLPGAEPLGPSANLKIIPDRKASPLVIHLNSDVNNPEPLIFSAITKGILFDILGAKSKPAPYTPKRISWHKSKQYLFVTLPDADGRVKGIDQLFGDNTKGPDGKFAANGFLALQKHDGNGDGYITKHDAVFSKLRLWRDDNFDGVAEASELLTLHDMGVNLLDLNYDPNYFEQDRHGNETRFKSVVQTDDNKIHLMFDIWFNYLDQ